MAQLNLASNVAQFIDRSAEIYGRIAADHFAQGMRDTCSEFIIESPIEQLFWVAMKVVCKVNGEVFNPEPWTDSKGNDHPGLGVHLIPQFQISKYRCYLGYERIYNFNDFVQGRKETPSKSTDVVVELDGHEFHERTKQERQYEKSRDRYLVARGYRVLHFTGTEVVADPYRVAKEALALVLNDDNLLTPEEYFGV